MNSGEKGIKPEGDRTGGIAWKERARERQEIEKESRKEGKLRRKVAPYLTLT